MGLKYFNKTEYTNLNEALSAIRKELLSLCPTDTDDVRWSRALDGAKAYIKKQGGVSSDSTPTDDATPAQSSYNGYFTIKLRKLEDGTQSIVVCDGMTYDNEKGTSDVSLASVNGKTYEVDAVEIVVPETNIYIVGEFIPPLYNEDGTELSDSRVEITTCNNVADYENNTENPDPDIVERFVTVIGEVIIKDTGVSIIQRHGTVASGASYNNGKLVIEYYVGCINEDTET